MESNGPGTFTEEVFHWKKEYERKGETGGCWRAKRGPTMRALLPSHVVGPIFALEHRHLTSLLRDLRTIEKTYALIFT
jgi:hypothetical protein